MHEYLISLHSMYEPHLNRSSALLCFERDNVVEIRKGIMLDFYLGLPHVNNYKNYVQQVQKVMASKGYELNVAKLEVLHYSHCHYVLLSTKWIMDV